MQTDLNVAYVANLARLNLSEEEIAKFQSQLTQVLEHVEKLKSVNVSHVDPTAHTSAVYNVLRRDESREGFTSVEALSNAPRQANDLFIVSKVIE